jgi:hypothetical protein
MGAVRLEPPRLVAELEALVKLRRPPEQLIAVAVAADQAMTTQVK